ncbi:hypothetical protein HanRHA438_Chr09g0392411 [Helianthus annuus]|nr:hypothetical protein HanIR_Chr09g0410381 [Helianthus annuus]KAJ0541867.1 hypothetical protein HanHA89_Chr09g0333431 [Helianthus annuus]KAJ0706942.1 hypothetical protein HanLR1_Chr09g0312881 [Helianthus annuus]KAJ0710961.1 hypothetical protein HanOQP8_Chr09g0318451 [Helianthus annuus]KAJ0887576.1 hypothetical protein HanRHA438_Chr09g0392411 [Helianthus annuus]
MVLFIDSCYQFLILDPSLITSLFDSSKCSNHPRSRPLSFILSGGGGDGFEGDG